MPAISDLLTQSQKINYIIINYLEEEVGVNEPHANKNAKKERKEKL
jgi:hypothetical protein